MSLASPHSRKSGSSSRCQRTHDLHPDKGSGSRQLAPLPQHTKASLGVRWPSTHLQAMASIAVQCVAQKRGPAHTNMNRCTRNHRGPPTLCGTTPSFPSLQLRQRKKKDSSLGGHPGTPIPQTFLFPPTVTSPTCSELFCLAQVTQENNQDMKDTPHGQHTPVRFPLPGKSPGDEKGLPTSQHVTSKAPAVYERTHTQQNA